MSLSGIHVYECALSDHRGETTFYLYEEPGMKNTCGQNALFRRGGRDKCAARDSRSGAKRPTADDFIKSDVEGADYLVLRGARAILEKHHPMMVIEAADELASKLGGSIAEILDILWGHGYEVSRLTRSGLQPVVKSGPSFAFATLVARFPSSPA